MRILLALSYSPYPVSRGTDRLIMNLIKGLSERHEVDLVTMVLERGGGEVLKEIEGGNVSVHSILAPNRRSAAHRAYYKMSNLLLSVLGGVPVQVMYAAPDAFLELIINTAKKREADLVLASYWHLYELPRLLTGTKLALITHDIDYLIHSQRLSLVSGSIPRFLKGIDARRRARIEREAYRRYETIITLTRKDEETLRNESGMSGKRILTLPLAMDLDVFDRSETDRENDRIVLMGSFDADFNRDALIHFIVDVLPLVVERRPHARLDVIGAGIDKRLKDMAGPNVTFTGYVEDINSHLGRCALMVLPLRYGGGVRIRMLEAAAMGTPVVSTPTGIAGMNLVDGRDYIEASTPVDMADNVLRLMSDRSLAGEIGRNARIWAERNVSMGDYPDRLDVMLSSLE